MHGLELSPALLQPEQRSSGQGSRTLPLWWQTDFEVRKEEWLSADAMAYSARRACLLLATALSGCLCEGHVATSPQAFRDYFPLRCY